MSEQPRSGGLDPETLAAYVEGQLPPEERAKVEAEIAADPETYEWLVHVLRVSEATGHVEQTPEPVATQEEPAWNLTADGRFPIEVPQPAPSPTPARVLPFFARPGVRAALGTLLTAAAVVLVVRMQPAWWQRLTGSDVDPRVASLVAAVGEARYIEGRLTGGFKYGPLRSVTRGPGDLSNQNLALLAAAGELQKKAQADPSAENLHAWGVAQLLRGDYDAGIATLESVASRQQADATVFSDLASAFLARHETNGSESDLLRARRAADLAVSRNPRMPEALFNRALVLERLGDAAATEAWTSVLAAERRGGFRAEAERHLQALIGR